MLNNTLKKLCFATVIVAVGMSSTVAKSRAYFFHSLDDTINIFPRQLLIKAGKQQMQQIDIEVLHHGVNNQKITVTRANNVIYSDKLKPGKNNFTLNILALKQEETEHLIVKIGDDNHEVSAIVKPVVPRALYFISHSHNDIGYSDLQTTVESKQDSFTRVAMALIRKTRDYPENAQFKWNVESLWALENFFRIASEAEKAEFIKDVKDGYIGLSAGYCNMLTGVCRPEELTHLTDYSRQLEKKYGMSCKTYMISDVPGMSWATIPALTHRGVKYISSGPNYLDRVGYTNITWDNKPFFWLSPSRQDTLLYWQAGKGYSWFHNWIAGRVGPKTRHFLAEYMDELDSTNYPYKMVQMRYTIIADNQGPDPNLPDFVKAWNEKYISPKIIISTVDNMMEKFVAENKNNIPVYAGDFTPYWEDGVMSSAEEEGLVKHSVERLLQANKINMLIDSTPYDSALSYKAWRNVVMWHEHTWGAWSSISRPDSDFTVKQWEYKQAFALRADSLSHLLLDKNIHKNEVSAQHNYDVYNTADWERNGLVYLSKSQSTAGDGIRDSAGNYYPSQRLKDGRLVFLARNIPADGYKTLRNVTEATSYQSQLQADNTSLENQYIKVVIDPQSGNIRHLIDKRNGRDFVDQQKDIGMNAYLYVPGKDPDKAEQNNNPVIRLKENGPLIATLQIVSQAPGAEKLIQEVSLVDGLDQVFITDSINKSKVRSKESVHFGFPVKVDNGKMCLDLGTGILQPEVNQLPGACKDFASIQRWLDISNKDYGLTITNRESPLVEIGEMVNELPGDNGVKVWKKKTDLSNTVYFYVMNNYWHTNYKADQEGWTTFHYTLYPHDQAFDAAWANQKGIETNQALLLSPAIEHRNQQALTVNNGFVERTILPAAAKNALKVTIYNADNQQHAFSLKSESESAKTDNKELIFAPFEIKNLTVMH